jgi:hypothetical protein
MNDPTRSPDLPRLADQVRDQLLALEARRHATVVQRLAEFEEIARRLSAARRKLALCHHQGWKAAARRVRSRVSILTRDIPYYLQNLERSLADSSIEVPSVSEIRKELDQTGQEFDSLQSNPSGTAISVRTDPIELQGVFLGEFAIQLEIPAMNELSYGGGCRIIALDPHPAGGNRDITHPHVSDERLCFGEAGAAIRQAIQAGRLCDFFLLVRSVLTHYNAGSPYVPLEDWHGTPCYDCGCSIAEEDAGWCRHCEREFCEECSSYCDCCESTICLGCLETCDACGEPTCPDCLTHCSECDRMICKACRDEVLCPCQHERKETPNDQEQRTQASNQTHAA